MINRLLTKSLFAMIIGLFAVAGAWGQGVYHMALVYETEPTGPNETFNVRLVMQEHDIDISGYQLIIGFDDSRGTFTLLSDNLGSGGEFADAIFTTGSEMALTGVPYANVAYKILLDTSANIFPPSNTNEDFNLGLLEFKTSATYNPADGHFGVYLAVDPDAGQYGVWDGAVEPVEVEFTSLEPGSSVADWSMY